MFKQLALIVALTFAIPAFSGETKPNNTNTLAAEIVPIADRPAVDVSTTKTTNATVPVTTDGKLDAKAIIAAVIAANDGRPVPDTFPTWLKVVITGAIGLWSLFGIPLIKKVKAGIDAHIAASKAAALANQIDMSKSIFEQKTAVAAQVKAFAEEQVWSIAQEEYPKIAKRVVSGEITDASAIKDILYGLNERVQAKIVEYFKAHGFDVIAAFGKTWLEKLIDAAVDKLPAFPGKDTAKELLDGTVSQLVVDYGIGWVKKWYSGELQPAVQEQAGLDGPPAKMFAHRYVGKPGPKGMKLLLQRTTHPNPEPSN